MRNAFSRLIIVLGLLTATNAVFAGQQSTPTAIAGKEKAWMLLSPKFVAEGECADMSWSHDGRFLLVNRTHIDVTPKFLQQVVAKAPNTTPPANLGEIIIFSLETGRSRVIQKYDAQKTSYQGRWLGTGSSIFFVLTSHEDGNSSGYISSADGDIRKLSLGDDANYVDFLPCPTRAEMAVNVHSQSKGMMLMRFNSSGPVGAPITTSSGSEPVGYLKNGTEILFSGYRKIALAAPSDARVKRQEVFYEAVNVLTGATRISSKVEYQTMFEAEEPELSVDSKAVAVDPKLKPLTPALFRAGDEIALIAGDVTRAVPNRQMTGVAYCSQGMVFVRSMAEMPLAAYLEAKEAAERTKIISNAKQVAFGLMIYAADNDDNLPSNQGKWQDSVFPYLKDRSLMDGFVMVFKGGNMLKVEDPANTILGYIPGKGGRAIAYVDGHVKWIKDGH